MTWQILEGASTIPITLFEAVADLDAGPIYLQQQIALMAMSLWKSGVLCRPRQRWSFAWFGWIATTRSLPQPNTSSVSPATTDGAGLPILS